MPPKREITISKLLVKNQRIETLNSHFSLKINLMGVNVRGEEHSISLEKVRHRNH